MDNNVTYADRVEGRPERLSPSSEANSSGVSWAAVFGGAVVAAALYLILLALGAGFGLSALSPWSNVGFSASAVGATAIIWLILIEIISSAMGGYLTGRLRTKWTLIHTDEVYFRDTANGFLAWSVALVMSVAFLASAAAVMVGGAEQAGSPPETVVAGSAVTDANAYMVDTLFRPDNIGSAASDNKDFSAQTEAARILENSLRQPQMPAADQSYLAQLIAAKTGVPLAQAEKRISDVVTNARQTEDAARKATAHFWLWFFLALLMGAFSASYAATIGGRQRDHVKAV